jgi:hypothetical protein
VNSLEITGAGEAEVSLTTELPAGTQNIGDVDVTNLPATVATNNGAADASTLRAAIATDSTISAENFPTTVDTNYGTPGASTVKAAAMLGVGSTAVSTSNPVPAQEVTTAIGSNTAVGETSCSALTATYATIVNPGFNVCTLDIFNGCNGVIRISIDSGVGEYYVLEEGESVSKDFCANGRHIANTEDIQAKDGVTPPTTGTLRISAAG